MTTEKKIIIFLWQQSLGFGGFFCSLFFFFPFFLLPSPARLFLQAFTVPVCIGARALPAGALSGISKITIFTALTFLPSSIILTVLEKGTSRTVSSALPLSMALLLFKKMQLIYSENMFFSFHIIQHLLPNCLHNQDRTVSVNFSNCRKCNFLPLVEKQQINKLNSTYF